MVISLWLSGHARAGTLVWWSGASGSRLGYIAANTIGMKQTAAATPLSAATRILGESRRFISLLLPDTILGDRYRTVTGGVTDRGRLP
jgi:hypothetical protein